MTNKSEAQKILEMEISTLRNMSYLDLVKFIGPNCTKTLEVVGESGAPYQVEVEAIWDDKAAGHLRVMVGVDDGGWRSFIPLTDDFIMAPNGSFIGENSENSS